MVDAFDPLDYDGDMRFDHDLVKNEIHEDGCAFLRIKRKAARDQVQPVDAEDSIQAMAKVGGSATCAPCMHRGRVACRP